MDGLFGLRKVSLECKQVLIVTLLLGLQFTDLLLKSHLIFD